jgi:hypothetical protein
MRIARAHCSICSGSSKNVAAPQSKAHEFHGAASANKQKIMGRTGLRELKCSGAVMRRRTHKGLETSHDHCELTPITNDNLAALEIREHLANLCP